jgi:hypothetical protein
LSQNGGALDDHAKEVVQGLRAEALAVFQVNQTARGAAERIFALTFAVTAIAATASTKIGTEVTLPLPSVVCLLLSYMFQLYADVAVLGAARAWLERQVNQQLGSDVLIYELAVADIRKSRPLVTSVVFLQILVALALIGLLAVGAVVAVRTRECVVIAAYFLVTSLSVCSLVLSLRHKQRAFDIATDRLNSTLRGALVASPPTHKTVSARRLRVVLLGVVGAEVLRRLNIRLRRRP